LGKFQQTKSTLAKQQ